MANWLKRIDEQANEEVAKWGMAPDAALKDVWVSKLEDAMERVQLGFKTRELADIVQENSTKGESMYLDEAKLPKHQLPVLGFVGAKITGIVRKLRAGRDAVGQHQHRNMLSGLYEQARSVRSFGDRNYS